MEQKKRLEEEAKKEEEKRLELERIQAGKLMQEAQKKREEQVCWRCLSFKESLSLFDYSQELIEAAAQRRRDKIEAEKVRERLKAQIKADRCVQNSYMLP